MSFGYGVGDIMAVSRLALKVYTAYKDAPGDYRNIADEVKSLHIIINEAAQHFESTTTPSSNKQHILESCQNLLRDLDALMEKYKALAPANTSQSFRRIKFGTEDIPTLRARLISNTTLLSSFIQRLDITTIIIEYIMLILQGSCDSHEMRAQFKRLNLRHTSSKDSLISFAASINTKRVYREFVKDLFKNGVTAETIKIHGGEICNRFKPNNATTSSHIDVNTTVDQSRLPDTLSIQRLDIATNTIEYIMLISRCSHDSDVSLRHTSSSGSLGLCRTSPSDSSSFIERLDIATNTIEYVMLISRRSHESDGLDEMQAQLDNVLLRIRRTSSNDSLVSLVGSTKAYRWFCKELFENGLTAEIIKSKEREFRNIFKTANAITSSQIDVSTNANHSQLPEVTSPLPTISTKPHRNRTRFAWVRPLMDLLVGPLMLGAAEAGNTKRLISTLEYVRNINLLDDTGSTALHKAACGGYNDIVQLLLMKGASIQAINHFNDTSLHLAARNGHTSTVELLHSKGASIEAINHLGKTPLHLAAMNGHTSTVELLHSKGASIEATNHLGKTPLHLAAMNGYTSTVELLLAKGASIETMDQDNNTPLHLAARNGHSSTVELLLAKGASTKAVNKENNTPLHLAARYGNAITVELLLSKGASVEAVNKDNDTPKTYETVSGEAEVQS